MAEINTEIPVEPDQSNVCEGRDITPSDSSI
jgi:hypothetical protein